MYMSDVETDNIALILINWIINEFILVFLTNEKKKTSDSGSKLKDISTHDTSTCICMKFISISMSHLMHVFLDSFSFAILLI